jgi:hypothetical protein
MAAARRDFLATSLGAALVAVFARSGAARDVFRFAQEPALRMLRPNEPVVEGEPGPSAASSSSASWSVPARR